MRPKGQKRMALHALATPSLPVSWAGIDHTPPGLDGDASAASLSADFVEAIGSHWENAWIDIGGEG